MKINKFEELEIWRSSLMVTKNIYDLTFKEKFSKDYYLKDQIRRATLSISSNIVEGFERNNNNEFIRFLKISKGSIGEIRSQLYVCLSINYIEREEFSEINTDLEKLSAQIGKLISYLQNKRKDKQFVETR